MLIGVACRRQWCGTGNTDVKVVTQDAVLVEYSMWQHVQRTDDIGHEWNHDYNGEQ